MIDNYGSQSIQEVDDEDHGEVMSALPQGIRGAEYKNGVNTETPCQAHMCSRNTTKQL